MRSSAMILSGVVATAILCSAACRSAPATMSAAQPAPTAATPAPAAGKPLTPAAGAEPKAAGAKTEVKGEAASPYARPGFFVAESKGRLWVFKEGTKDLAEFQHKGEPAKRVIRPAAGPNRMTIQSSDNDTIVEYLATKPGYFAQMDKGRVWVFREGSKELAEFKEKGSPAKHVVRPGVGPLGATVKAPDAATIDAWATIKPGFFTSVDKHGRLWVFREGSRELAEFREKGEPEKHIVRPRVGPGGMTVKAPDAETIEAYLGAS